MPNPVICIGAALVDELFHATDEMLMATTNDAIVTKTAGGVSRNIAHQLALLDVPVQLITVVGNDSDGDWLKQVCTAAGVQMDATITKDGLSGKYTGIMNVDGSLFSAFLTNAANHLITPEHLSKHTELLGSASFILADANINVDTAEWLLDFCKKSGIPFIIEPVSVPPAKKFFNANLDGLFMITPNEDELPVLCTEQASMTQMQIEELLERGVQNIWLHNGKMGSALYNKEKAITLHAPDIEVVVWQGLISSFKTDMDLFGHWLTLYYLGEAFEE